LVRLLGAAAVAVVVVALALVLSSGGSEEAPAPSTGATAVGRHKPEQQSRGSVEREHERRDVARVPSLIGLTPDEVRERLDPLGLETVFSAHCEGRPPLGRVIDQYPSPGKKPAVANVSHGPQVQLDTDVSSACSDKRAERTCEPSDLALEADGAEGELAGQGGRYLESLEVRNTSATSCQLEATATLTLTSLYGANSDAIRGNPAQLVIDWRLQPKATFRRS
jgi:hypothetical protein